MLNEMNQNQNRQAVRYLFPDKKNHSNYQKINKKTEPPSQKREIKPRKTPKPTTHQKIQFTKQSYSRIIQARNRYDTCVLNYFQFIYLTINVN